MAWQAAFAFDRFDHGRFFTADVSASAATQINLRVIGEAGFFADVIVLMRDGAIVQTGTLNDLVRSPADPFVTRFINAQRAPFDALRDDMQ